MTSGPAEKEFGRLSRSERERLLLLLFDSTTNNWNIHREFPIFSCMAIERLRTLAGDLYVSERKTQDEPQQLRLIKLSA